MNKAIAIHEIVKVEEAPVSGVQSRKNHTAAAYRETELPPSSRQPQAPSTPAGRPTMGMVELAGCDVWRRMQGRQTLNQSSEGRYRLCSDGVFRHGERAKR